MRTTSVAFGPLCTTCTPARRAARLAPPLPTTQLTMFSCTPSQHMGIWPTVYHRRLPLLSSPPCLSVTTQHMAPASCLRMNAAMSGM